MIPITPFLFRQPGRLRRMLVWASFLVAFALFDLLNEPLRTPLRWLSGAGVLAFPLVDAVIFLTRRAIAQAQRTHFPKGACQSCGYDLQGLAPAAPCPECGAIRPAAPPQPSPPDLPSPSSPIR